MLFTSQYFSTGQQSIAASPSSSTNSLHENSRQVALLCTDQVGTPSIPCDFPGHGDNNKGLEKKSSADMLIQNHFTMKNARKQLGEISNDPTQIKPGPIVSDNPDAFPVIENQIFYEKPIARQPESPDTESFRSWLKTNTSRHKASPALVERISRITHDENA